VDQGMFTPRALMYRQDTLLQRPIK
jgi:hypothetical protein